MRFLGVPQKGRGQEWPGRPRSSQGDPAAARDAQEQPGRPKSGLEWFRVASGGSRSSKAW